MKTLIVDDNPQDRKLLKIILKAHGWETFEAEDGGEGFSMAISHRPELIISDALMPNVDGFQFLKNVRSSPELADIPFVFYSAVYTGVRDKEVALSMGATAFIAKPKDPDELWQELGAALKKGRRAKAPAGYAGVGDERFLQQHIQVVAAKLEEKVAELEQAKGEVEETARRYRNLFNSIRDVIITADLNRVVTNANQPALRQTFGYETEEVLGASSRLLYADAEDFQRVGREMFEQEEATHRLLVVRMRKKSGGCFSAEILAQRLLDENGRVTGNIAMIRDITERERAERESGLLQAVTAALAEVGDLDAAFERVLRLVCEATGWPLGEAWIPDPSGAFLEPSGAWTDRRDALDDFLKASRRLTFTMGTGLPGKVWLTRQPEWMRDIATNPLCIRNWLLKGSGLNGGLFIPILDGETVVAVIDFLVFETREEDERLMGLITAVATQLGSLIKRKQAERELQEVKNYLNNIINSMPSVLIGIDENETVTHWNQGAEMSTGITVADAVGRRVGLLIPDFYPWIEALRAQVKESRAASLEKVLLIRDGERRFFDLMFYPLLANNMRGAVVRIEDVTERARIQELMVQTEKMMSVGGLAAGMAHEINNPLGIIAQAAQNIERRLSLELPSNREAATELGVSLELFRPYLERRQIPQFVDSIRQAADRAARIVSNMLQFSRQAPLVKQPARLERLIGQAVELAANDYDLKKRYDFRAVEIVHEYQPDMPEVPVVEVEIEQVMLNLVRNAAQAMSANPPDRKPRIVFRVSQEGKYAVVEVEDNGPGMEEKVVRRVFEPFFTTKEPGVGTGLGLSVSYMIVTVNHKGFMEVESSPGAGARFTMRLPLIEEA